ncbi:MAG: glycosyltransferase [Candidatus Eiseniibacteriota bacterium]
MNHSRALGEKAATAQAGRRDRQSPDLANRPHIVFVLPSFAGGGAERVTLQLLAALDPSTALKSLVVLDSQGPLARDVGAGVDVIDLRAARLRRALPALVGALRRLGPEIVFSTFAHLNIALLAARPLLPRGMKIVVRDANIASASLARAPYGRLIAGGVRWLYPRADRILCTSERMMRDFAENFGVPPERMALLPNPVDERTIRQRAAAPVREPGAGLRFVAAGRLTEQKGFDRLLDWFAALSPDAHLTIIGEGRDRGLLGDAARRLGLDARVRFTGFLANPWEHMAGADAFLLPSRWEGLPNVALEALACGTPVIATTEAGGIDEIAAAARRGAVAVVEPGAAFVDAMRAVRPVVAAAPRDSLLPRVYRSEAVAARFASLINEILAQRAGSA